MPTLFRISVITLASAWLTAAVATTEGQPGFTQAPPPPGPSGSEEELQPEVTIIRRKERTVEEYRVNGKLYMIRVTPSRGQPYYLVDSDGNGNFDMQRTAGPDLQPRMLIPGWVLLRW